MKLGVCSCCQQGNLRIDNHNRLFIHFVPGTSVRCDGSEQEAEVVYLARDGKVVDNKDRILDTIDPSWGEF